MGQGPPGIGQASQPGTVAERGQVAERDRVVKVVEGGVEARSEDKWVKDLTDAANSFSGLAALNIATEDTQGAG